jgi:lactate dehydrogenase-like 2-hydroxyacid dehydrogenase
MPYKDSLPITLVTYALPPEWLTILDRQCHPIIAPPEHPGFGPQLRTHLEDAEGILTLLTDQVNDDLLDQMPNIKVVSNMAVGVDNIDIPACTRRGIPVGHTPGVLTDATADLAIALILAAARRLPESSTDAKEGRWTTWTPDGWLGHDLSGATVGIVGMGKIGSAIAERVNIFGIQLLYSSRSPKPDVEQRLGAIYCSLNDLLEKSDFLILAVDLNDGTRGLINEKTLQTMKSSAILVNISRGPVVNTFDLVKALQERWIAAAALDVTDPEPLPSDHPLYTFQNCLITPHIGSATKNTRRRMAELACENLVVGINNKRLLHCVNPEVYDT